MSRTGDLEPHVLLRFGINGHTEGVLRGRAGVGNIGPASGLKRLAPLRAIDEAADSGGLAEADDPVAVAGLWLRQHSGAVLCRIQAEGEFQKIHDAVMVELVEVRAVAGIVGAAEVRLSPGLQRGGRVGDADLLLARVARRITSRNPP